MTNYSTFTNTFPGYFSLDAIMEDFERLKASAPSVARPLEIQTSEYLADGQVVCILADGVSCPANASIERRIACSKAIVVNPKMAAAIRARQG